MLGEKNSTQ